MIGSGFKGSGVPGSVPRFDGSVPGSWVPGPLVAAACQRCGGRATRSWYGPELRNLEPNLEPWTLNRTLNLEPNLEPGTLNPEPIW